ncbi:MAG: ATP-dependent helicase DinG [Acidimicrobiaceae bacterium]|jgi:ATP-dependent DNA helicase DinG|nr:ATP-dependent helicase DinG [Acidimicrobiaceae bacterium]
MPGAEVETALRRVTAALPGGGEARDGQARMADAVAAAIEGGRHLVVQAGTGTGKSLAYLVPAILSGRRIVVATATKALQDQLADKDLPFLQAQLGAEHAFEFAVLKGRSNYLCRQRMREVAGGDDQLELDDDVGPLGREIARLIEFGADCVSGDRAELSFEPRAKAWSSVSVSAMECPGAAKCPSGAECFAEAARQKAAVADVIVVNTHLYATHLASGGFVLPDHDVVVFDEAHQLEDVAASGLGIELTAGRLRTLARLARPLLGKDPTAADELEGAAALLEAALEPWRGKRLPADLGEHVGAVAALTGERARRLVSAVRTADGDEARKARVMQAGGHLVGDLAMVAEISDGDVAWVEGQAHAPALKVAPVDVSAVLAARLWGERTAILTSATIPPNLIARLGLPPDETDQLDVGSPFPYADHGVLYCAAHLPDPRSPAYEAAMHDELEALVQAAGGRTLALFTSWRAMNAAADALRPRLPFDLLTQSDLPKPALLRAFIDDERACLFATMGFWQGVDVPGRSLSLVVLDRLPFPRPDEPLMQARRDKAGAAAFRLIDLPRAATLLAQGAGRLIRSATDRGVVAVLDPRLASKSYRWDLVRALPPMRRTRHRAEVEAFLADVLTV